MKRNQIITAIDVGTTKVATIIAECSEEGAVRVLGVGMHLCRNANDIPRLIMRVHHIKPPRVLDSSILQRVFSPLRYCRRVFNALL